MNLRAFLLALFCLGFGVVTAAETAGIVLSDEDTDKTLEDIFKRAKDVTRVEALMVTTIKGSKLFKRETKQYEDIRFAMPPRVWKLGREESEKPIPEKDCNLVVYDGTYLWELQPDFGDDMPREASRRKINKDSKAVSGDAGVAVFLLRTDVASTKELREEFESIRCVKSKTDYHFTLVGKNKKITIDLWIKIDGVIPWKVQTKQLKKVIKIGKKDDKPKYKESIETRELRNVKTNLDGLKPFPVDTFVFPYKKGMVVLGEGNEELKAGQIQEDLKKVRAAIVADFEKEIKNQKSKGKNQK